MGREYLGFSSTRLLAGLLFLGLTPQGLAEPLPDRAPESDLHAGFAALSITPQVPDQWADVDGNAQFNEDIDTWTDGNGNGRFDPVWMAGFQNQRPAQGVHDEIMAIVAVLDDGDTRIAIVAADTIGLMRKFVQQVRTDIPESWDIDYLLLHATHNHEGPDTQGLWGASAFSSGVSTEYMSQLRQTILAGIEEAIGQLEPATLSWARIPTNPLTPIVDKRKPKVVDEDIRALLFRRDDESVIGTIINFGIHVELAWDQNLELTADVAGYLRRGVSDGIRYDDSLMQQGLGGTTLWLTGNIGGLMTSGPEDAIYDAYAGKQITQPSHEKARVFGHSLASSVIAAVEQKQFAASTSTQLGVSVLDVELGIDNPMLALGTLIGLVDSSPSLHWRPPFVRYDTEVSILTIGDALIVGIPGELYPEIAVGGIENPSGADYALPPQEIPHLRGELPGKVNLMVNLANDAIGYIIPKSEWDNEAPWIYGEAEETYGEVVSLGPETAPAIHRSVMELLRQLQ